METKNSRLKRIVLGLVVAGGLAGLVVGVRGCGVHVIDRVVGRVIEAVYKSFLPNIHLLSGMPSYDSNIFSNDSYEGNK